LYPLLWSINYFTKKKKKCCQSRVLLTVDYAPFTEVYGRAAAGG